MRRIEIALFALALFGCAARDGSPDDVLAPEARGNWPQFRGPAASGVADGQSLPATWDGAGGENVLWKVRVPGLAHSSPVIWGERMFVTTAVNTAGDSTFKPGLYGDGDAADDRAPHRFVVLALDKRTGEVLWERTAKVGVPQDKRHIKATYANATPATDGRRVVALFGSEGLFAFDLDGNPLWHRDLGRLDAGAYDAQDYEWGSASSPILHDGRVIVQCDTQGESFVEAFDAATGEPAWRVVRDEPPSWATPTVWPSGGRDVLVTNAPRLIRGYDARTGEELWRLGGSSMITAPTPVYDAHATGLLVVGSGRRPEKPLFVIRPGALGDLTLEDGATSNEFIAWSQLRRGPYMPTPLIYRGQLYVLNNDGVFDAYELATGRELYRERIPHGGSGFSASPVAADGLIYLPGEDGAVFIVRAGPTFELVGSNGVPEPLMATPALSDGRLYLRGERHLYAIGR